MKNDIGKKIKELQNLKKITNEDLSKRSGVNIELIEKIEAGEMVPSLTPLTKLARALGVRLGTFLDDSPAEGPVIIRKGHSEKTIRFSGEENNTTDNSLEFFSLGVGKIDRHMEPFIIDIDSKKEEYKLSSHEGEEFIYVLQGEIEVIYGQDSNILKAGDSIYYDSVVLHHLHSHNGENAKILAVIYTPF